MGSVQIHTLDRSAEPVRRDVRHGIVSADGARAAYGVVASPAAYGVVASPAASTSDGGAA